MKEFLNVHPGEVLKEEFLEPMGITAYRLAKSIEVQQIQISRIIKGELGISADMATRLGKFFGNSAEFWMNLNRNHELRKVRHENEDIINSIKCYKEAS
ncbi:HigA family addiction module antidote protein [Fulvivirga sp. M361]|uniref:HigA family addiction module antitoxin n=1 Tax=Fulvivirga sp. M361 TaxID=2594266 RepID=UPI00117BA181|nr:HigA family addiction module antitoxin [Fulvivirga sp. M361]TRX60654.1 HigA family addiction module antidote protein [Fulvivirga sp. M361]